MSTTAFTIAAAATLSVTALAAWAWIAARRFATKLHLGLEGMHFDN